MRHADGVGRWLPRACGLLAILLGALDLVGWQLDSLALKAVLPGLVAMQPVGASCLVLAGAALMLGTGSPPAMQAGAAAAACMVLLVSAEALAQYVTGADFGTDRLLFPQAVLRQPVPYAFPGRMAPVAAIEFSLLGAALLLVRARAIRARAAGVALATLGLLLAATALLGYLFDVGSLQRVGFYVAVVKAGLIVYRRGGARLYQPWNAQGLRREPHAPANRSRSRPRACSAVVGWSSGDSSRRSSPECGRGASGGRAARR
jgi:hypothetical protein